MHYYDPMFYLCSDKMPFGFRIDAELKYAVDGDILRYAVNTAIKRYPYFAVKIVNSDGELITVKNDLPIKVFKGKLLYPLGSAEVNYHILALSYFNNKINFHMTHVMTDGRGFMPFMKTVLYYYLCKYLNTELDRGDIRLVGDEMLEGENGNPYPEKEMETATPFYTIPDKEYLRLADCGYVTDNIPTTYFFRTRESDVMKFSHDNDASPCALFSSVMAKAIWDVHPNETKDIVSAISFNMRPGLNAENNYRMLCSAIKVRYPKRLYKSEVSKICTCTRGAVTVQSQPENVHYYVKCQKSMLEKLLKLPDVKSKTDALSKAALEDSVNNTFSVSYVGKVDYGSLREHIEKIRFFTDGSTHKTLFIEVSSFNGWFYITVLQGFSSDIYYKSLLNQLKENGIEYVEEGGEPFDFSTIALPQ